MASRIKPEKREAAGLGDFKLPTAQENREIAVIVGTIRQKAPNCVHYGDLVTIPVTKKVPNPAFFGLVKKTMETGQYRYFLGMALALGQGAGGVKLREFQIDDQLVWSGNISSGTFSFDKSTLFGGEEKEGGYAGTFDFYGGTWTQTFNSYLESLLVPQGSKARNWQGLTYIVQRGPSAGNLSAGLPNGYVGISENLKPFSFVLERFPDNLGQTAYSVINSTDANPIEWAYEVLTNQDYGANIPAANIDLAAFQAAAQTVHSEGLGCSVLWDTDREISDVLNDINELIDGAIFVDRSTGLWTVKLARADYDIEDLFIFDDTNVLEETSFSTNTGKDAPSQIIVPFVDKAQNFKTREADFKDLAARRNQAAPNQKKTELYGVSNATEAAQLAFREARIFASNLRKVNFKANREAHFVRPFTVFRYQRTDAETGELLDIVFRAFNVNDGELLNGEVEIEAVEDVFSLGTLHYSPPPTTAWQDIAGAPVAVSVQYLAEQPFFISGEAIKLWAFGAQPNGAQRNFDLFAKKSADSNYILQVANNDFAPSGVIVSDYLRTAARDTANNLVITITNNIERLIAATQTQIAGEGMNLFLFEDSGEICAFESITNNGDGTATLNNIWRGLWDTTTEKHAAGTRVWFFSYGQAAPETSVISATAYNAKLLPNSLRGQLTIGSATAMNLTPSNRQARPLPPVDVQIQSVQNPSAIPAAGNDISVSWKIRNRLTQSQILLQTDASQTPEAGATIGIKIYDGAGVLLATHEGLTGTSYNYTSAQQTTDGATGLALTFVIYSIRSGVSSLQAVRFATARPTGTPAATLPTFTPIGTPPAPSDYTGNIGGILISGTPDATNNMLVFNSSTNTIVWAAGSGGAGVWYYGTGAPSGGLGINGDFYIRTTTEDIYKKITGTWTIIANFYDAQLLEGTGILIEYSVDGETVQLTLDQSVVEAIIDNKIDEIVTEEGEVLVDAESGNVIQES